MKTPQAKKQFNAAIPEPLLVAVRTCAAAPEAPSGALGQQVGEPDAAESVARKKPGSEWFKEPRGYPVSLQDALKLWLPELSSHAANEAFKSFLAFCLSGERWRPATPEEIAKAYRNHQAKPMDRETFLRAAGHFVPWHQAKALREKRSAAGKAGGNRSATRRLAAARKKRWS